MLSQQLIIQNIAKAAKSKDQVKVYTRSGHDEQRRFVMAEHRKISGAK